MSDFAVIAETVMQLVFPPRCLFCDAIIPINSECEACTETVKKYKLSTEARSMYHDKNLVNLDGVVSCFVYRGEIAQVVARYKFQNKPDLFRYMAKCMADDFNNVFADKHVDIVTCVPSYKSGNEHSRLLAAGVAKRLGIPFSAKLINKIRKTEKQHELEFEDRLKNIKDAFAAKAGEISGKKILLCDDVLTSGNTVNECAAALKHAGAKEVFACTFSATR